MHTCQDLILKFYTELSSLNFFPIQYWPHVIVLFQTKTFFHIYYTFIVSDLPASHKPDVVSLDDFIRLVVLS